MLDFRTCLTHSTLNKVLLHHNPVTPQCVLEELSSLLQDMSPRTRRPIRFLEAPHTHPLVRA